MSGQTGGSGGNGLAAVIAALVGFLALLVSAYTAYVQRQQTRAQIWPRLMVEAWPDEHVLGLHNKGVGPAIIRNVRVYIDGRPQQDWKQVFQAQGVTLSQPSQYSSLNGIVVAAGEEVQVLHFANDADTKAALVKPPGLEICYCSVLDDCWVMDPDQNVREVRSCPVDPAIDFRQ